jgi:DNA repair protein RadC
MTEQKRLGTCVCDGGFPDNLNKLAHLIADLLCIEHPTEMIYKLAEMLKYGMTAAEIEHLGFSPARATRITSALTLGAFLNENWLQYGERFGNSKEIFQRYRPVFLRKQKEHVLSLALNSKNCLLKESLISIGSLSTSVVHPREAFVDLIKEHAAACIFIHNHPSGDPAPSREDTDMTQRMVAAGKLLGIRVLDHTIIGFDDYYSFADAGRIAEWEAI